MKKFQKEINKLTTLQYNVTQNKGTEPPFNNEYNNEYREGIYVDIVSNKALFSSKDKFDSGSGWPSFTKPVKQESVIEHLDTTHGMVRTEVASKDANTHLGHVFDDGPNNQKRYCINSASIRFIPKENLNKEGFEAYADIFKQE